MQCQCADESKSESVIYATCCHANSFGCCCIPDCCPNCKCHPDCPADADSADCPDTLCYKHAALD